LLDTFTINEEPKNKEDLVEIIWQALKYFPKGIWEGVEYLGNVNIKHDLKVEINKRPYGAFLFQDLIKMIRETKKTFKSDKLLLAVTHDPVIAIYYQFEVTRLIKISNLVRDFVSKELGIVSFFEIEDEVGIEITAHGLGHSEGLIHHTQPIDLMYEDLLRRNLKLTKKDGFCDTCQQKLKNRIVI